jgi:glycosyltransferase involved in cell wall biosynthesis
MKDVEKPSPDLSVVIPVYKNLDTIEPLYFRLVHVLENARIQFEIVFVDDACPQQSHKIIRSLIERDTHVSALLMKYNIGQHSAVLAGLNVADGRAIAIMDADLQDPPEALPVLCDKLNEGYDVVFGGRSGKYEVDHRLLTSRFYKLTMHLLTGNPSDAGLFLVAKHVFLEKIIETPMSQPNLLAMIGTARAKTISIPIERAPRLSGKSAYTSWMRLKMGVQAIKWIMEWRLGFHSGINQKPYCCRFPIAEKLGQKFLSLVKE